MEKKNLTLYILSLSAVVLMMLNYFVPQRAEALMTIKDRDISLVTARTQNGGDALYVLDNRSGRVAVFSYDPARRSLVPRMVGDMSAAFAPNNGGGAGQ
jgi:hypothetical protein